MVNRIKYERDKLRWVNSPITRRTWEQQKYRNKIAKLLKNSRKMWDAWKIKAEKILNKEKYKFKYLMAKYWTDKQWILNMIKHEKLDFYSAFFDNIDNYHWLDKEVAIALKNRFGIHDIFFYHIDNFSWLDEDLAIEIFEDYDPNARKIWGTLDRFSVGDKFIINYLKNKKNKNRAFEVMLEEGYFEKKINYSEKFINYLSENNIWNSEIRWYLRVLLLIKKTNNKTVFDENDANYVNELVKLWLWGKISEWLEENIMKFPDESLDYSVFTRTYRRYTHYGDPHIGDGISYYYKTWVDVVSFRKFKKDWAAGRGDKSFNYLYYKVYQEQENEKRKKETRESNLAKMKNMTFVELLRLYLSYNNKWKEEIKEWEIIKILLSKKIKPWEEITKRGIKELFNKLDAKTQKKFLKKLKGIELK